MRLNTESAIQDLVTVRDFLRWTTSRLNESEVFLGHGFDDTWDEAVALVLYALHLPWDADNRVMDARVTLDEKEQITYLVKQRIEKRTPVAYLTQTAWFAGMPFFVDERVLIPRSPMAELIENGFEPWLESSQINRALDLCTGSGCIAIAMAMALPDAMVDAVDISAEALEVAKINVDRHGVEEQVNLIQSDCFAALTPENQYQLIITNPPYVGSEEMVSLPEEYQQEPELALAAGADGLDIVRQILLKAPDYLASNGVLLCEVGNSDLMLEQTFPRVPFTWIDFERGGHGVFFLTRDEIIRHRDDFE